MTIRQSPVKIFLAGKQHKEAPPALGDLLRLDDEWRVAGQTVEYRVQSTAWLVVLPLTGVLEFFSTAAGHVRLTAAQVWVLPLASGETYTVRNTSGLHHAGYLQLLLQREAVWPVAVPALADYNLNRFMNVLMKIAVKTEPVSPAGWHLSIGKFSANAETSYHTRDKKNGLFVFVIEGLFDVQGRLLQARDALAIWDTSSVRATALRQDAVLLTIECPVTSSFH